MAAMKQKGGKRGGACPVRVLVRGASARAPAEPSELISGRLGELPPTVPALLTVFASVCAAGKDGPLKELYGLLGI